jgi:hypothetical protein
VIRALAQSKLRVVVPRVVQASIHSRWWPIETGIVGAGGANVAQGSRVQRPAPRERCG